MYQYLDGFFVYGTFRNFFTGDQFPNEGWHTEAEFSGSTAFPFFLYISEHTAHSTQHTEHRTHTRHTRHTRHTTHTAHIAHSMTLYIS